MQAVHLSNAEKLVQRIGETRVRKKNLKETNLSKNFKKQERSVGKVMRKKEPKPYSARRTIAA